ncbi:MAG: NADH-quinone oxidoreductase subunit C [Gammaproteobacteria bacterium]|nr:NADH-quinone oxidoreductase subunit C [Gammaproteobacteria bacterium]
MPDTTQSLAARLLQHFGTVLKDCREALGEVTIELQRAHLLQVCTALRDEPAFAFEQLIDLCGVDYLHYGQSSKGEIGLVAEDVIEFPEYPEQTWEGPRFAVVYHLLSIQHNKRLRLKVFLSEDLLVTDSVVNIWASADWYEREAFDFFGILFEGHPDLRRILTDYGFIGHPMRKDFPLIGQVEMRYDPDKKRVVYEPVSIKPRILVPRVIRKDHRYVADAAREGAERDGNS